MAAMSIKSGQLTDFGPNVSKNMYLHNYTFRDNSQLFPPCNENAEKVDIWDTPQKFTFANYSAYFYQMWKNGSKNGQMDAVSTHDLTLTHIDLA